MTARKPKPRKASSRKRFTPTLSTRADDMEAAIDQLTANDFNLHVALREMHRRIEALETRDHFRDASHDEPVSNAGEAIGGFRILGELPTQSRWRRFLTFMGAP